MKAEDVLVRASDGASFGAHLATPDKVPAPGIVVLQEIFGLSSFVRGVCDEFARAGYIAIAPDLFWRQEPNLRLDSEDPAGRERGMKLLQSLDETLAVQDAAASLSYLRARPECTGKVAAVGYCLGGKLAYLMAARTDVDAAVSYYGVRIHAALGEAKNLRAPLLLHMAANDQLCPPEAQKEIARVLGHEPRVTIHSYEGVGHAFARKGSAAYQAAAAQSADAQTMEFLTKHLRE